MNMKGHRHRRVLVLFIALALAGTAAGLGASALVGDRAPGLMDAWAAALISPPQVLGADVRGSLSR